MTVKDKIVETIDNLEHELIKIIHDINDVGSLRLNRKHDLVYVAETALLALADAKFSVLSDEHNPYFIVPFSVGLVTFGQVFGEIDGAKKISKMMSDYAKLGNAKNQPLKDLSIRLVTEKTPPYPSRRNAALSIEDEIIQAGKALNPSVIMSKMQAETTITGWLKEAGLLPPKPKARKYPVS